VVGLGFDELPESVVAKVKEVTTNSWGVQLAASTLPWSKSSYRFVRSQGGTPQSTVVNYGMRTSAANAAFINGCFAHGFELDDIHPTGVKGGCVTVPTAMAIGELQLNDGKQFLTAQVAAYEVMCRMTRAGYRTMHDKGHHTTGHVGSIGAAAITSKLLGFDEDLTCHALGIAVVQMNGLQFSGAEARSDRGYLKRTYGGTAAYNGIRSALLAQEGMTTADVMLEPGAGFCRAFDVDDEAAKKFTAGLGEHWEILQSHYKTFAQDGHIQPMTEGLRRIQSAHPFTAAEVESITVGTNRPAHDLIVGQIREPKDLTDAQYSAYFSLGLYIVKGSAGFREYTEENVLNDKEIIELGRKVSLYVDDEIEEEFRRTHPRAAKVTVRLRSGEELYEYVTELPDMTPEAIDDKFRNLATVVLDDARSEALLGRIHSLDEVRDISTLAPLLVP
jgi:2-methylcitrate dehydratase PrpD